MDRNLLGCVSDHRSDYEDLALTTYTRTSHPTPWHLPRVTSEPTTPRSVATGRPLPDIITCRMCKSEGQLPMCNPRLRAFHVIYYAIELSSRDLEIRCI